MPRSDKGRSNSTFPSHNVNSIFPRTSYTGPLMPRIASTTPVVRPTPTPMQVSSPSFMQSLKEGFSFGAGVSIARNVVDRMFGSNTPVASPPVNSVPPTMPVHPVEPKVTIGEDQHLYHKCIQDGGKHETCKDYLV
jgi:hypothetical protein